MTSVDSTNNYAMGRVQKGLATHGEAYFAWEQTKGKGQREKQWLSTKGENIILSIVLDTSAFFLHKQFFLSMAAALSARDLFNKYTTNKALIKWPNDIYYGDRKAGGILIENIIQGDAWRFAVVGFGVNINQTLFDASLKHATSLKQITGESYDLVRLSKELCSILQQRFVQLENEEEQSILAEYNSALYRKRVATKFKAGSRIFSATVKYVDENGRLFIGDAAQESFKLGEVEWLPD